MQIIRIVDYVSLLAELLFILEHTLSIAPPELVISL
jgi:hypothetical protein